MCVATDVIIICVPIPQKLFQFFFLYRRSLSQYLIRFTAVEVISCE